MVHEKQLYLFILICCDSNELGLFEGDVGDQTMVRPNTHNVELWFVLMERVQHDLKTNTFINGLPLVGMPVCTGFYPFIPVVTLR